MRTARQQQGGAVLVLLALSMVVLIAAAGLAIDSGRAYIVKSQLNAAVDSASLAAARAVPQGASQTEQIANATTAARRFFAANYGSGFMGSTATMSDPTYVFDAGKITIDVNATAVMPVTLMGVLGFKTLTPVAHAQTIRKDLDMMLVMDTSGSLASVAANVRSSAITFLSKFNSSQDRVGLVHFANGSQVDDAINLVSRGFDRTEINKDINAFDFSGSTNTAEGMWNARAQLNGIVTKNRSSMRVIVLFSDGAPNAISAYFPFKSGYNCTTAGSMWTASSTEYGLQGLYRIDKPATELSGDCNIDNTGSSSLSNRMTGFPAWYNAHNTVLNPNDTTTREFPIVTSSPRVVTSDMSSRSVAWKNLVRASENLPELIAAKARDEGVVVLTLGLGSDLLAKQGPDNETGESILKCIANTTDARAGCYNAAKPAGLYCYAATVNDLSPCFTKLASAILRISQ